MQFCGRQLIWAYIVRYSKTLRQLVNSWNTVLQYGCFAIFYFNHFISCYQMWIVRINSYLLYILICEQEGSPFSLIKISKYFKPVRPCQPVRALGTRPPSNAICRVSPPYTLDGLPRSTKRCLLWKYHRFGWYIT